MSIITRGTLFAALGALVAAGFILQTSCSRQGPPEPLALEQVPAALTTAFASSDPELKALVAGVAGAVETNDLPTAASTLQAICARTDLSRQQRELSTQALLGVNEALRTAAESGNAASAEFIRQRQSNK